LILEINRRLVRLDNFRATFKYFVNEISSDKRSFACAQAIFASRFALKSPAWRCVNFITKYLAVLNFLLLFGSSQKVSAESLGKYKNIEQKLSTGQLALAQSLIAAFSPTTNIENNYKTFYTLQRAYLQNNDLTLLQNIQLLLLAHQCPFTDGAIVYNARALYGLANMVSIDYNDTYCAQLGFSFKTNNSDSIGNTVISDQLYTELIRNEKVSKETFKNKTNYFLFPNPAKDELFVNSANTENELVELEILDANAKTIAKQVVSINNYLGKLNLNLISGIYTVKITTKQGNYEYKKLIISR
jgi:hypothetical protein